MDFNFRFPFLVDPDEPLRRRERTITIRMPRWLARLLGDPERRRLLINITMDPR